MAETIFSLVVQPLPMTLGCSFELDRQVLQLGVLDPRLVLGSCDGLINDSPLQQFDCRIDVRRVCISPYADPKRTTPPGWPPCPLPPPG